MTPHTQLLQLWDHFRITESALRSDLLGFDELRVLAGTSSEGDNIVCRIFESRLREVIPNQYERRRKSDPHADCRRS